ELPEAAVAALERNPQVDYISPDGPVKIVEEEVELETEDNEGFEPLEATIPTGIKRIFASANKALDIDGQDDVRANVDVAVIDTGIDPTHPELNVVSRTDCTIAAESCIDNSGPDQNSHGTHVAGTIGALDNGIGVVGVAAGARLWSVKVLDAGGYGSFSEVTAGVDWVTAHASEIEVANMSIGSSLTVLALNQAIEKSIEKGVVYAIAAGNRNEEVHTSPANVKSAITVSAIADYDGEPGGTASPSCGSYGLDDRKASFSNYGLLVDIAAPGVCILSTKPGSSYGLKSGTSMAAPHVAGAAALLAAKSNPNSLKDVESIVTTLRATGNYNWIDTSGDGVKEPLLGLNNETTYALVSAPVAVTAPVTFVGMGAATETYLAGTVNPKGLAATYQFEIVEASKYKPEAENPYAEGTKLPLSPAALTGTVDKDYEVKQLVTGLKAGTLYHYRVIAQNSKGLVKGSDQTFTALPPCQGAEGNCSWSLQSTANPVPRTENELEDVSCASSTMCMAVGNDRYLGKGFAELWNGSEWKVVTSGLPELKAISCPSATWCVLVGRSEGKSWQLKWTEFLGNWSWKTPIESPPTPEGGTGVELKDVSCTSESACTTVGRYNVGGTPKPYVARWDGSAWGLQTAPSPAEGSANEALQGVSCASSTFCVAVGTANKKPFAERWNGSEWTTLAPPNPEGATEARLEGVSCPTISACVAVGYLQPSGGGRKTLAERWNGSSWVVVSTPNPAKEGWAQLRSVSCLSGSSCIAVGSLSSPNGFVPQEEATIAQSWNGTSWTLQSSPNGAGNLFSSFAAVSCSSTVACTAVGKTRPGSSQANMVTLGARWR
ncbi:MAG TPA: S8 family serine peptidase, partial [Solirubrobacterales bacterium]|nr:S8 family serine peptidase [Solirubrobacterales bacterium]